MAEPISRAWEQARDHGAFAEGEHAITTAIYADGESMTIECEPCGVVLFEVEEPDEEA